MELRYYQREAVDAIWSHIRTSEDNALAVLPTGAGKSLVLSQLAKDVIGWGGRVVMLSHVKELVAQVAEHIQAIAPEIPLGIYSAGLKSRDLGYPVTVAGIQSAVNAAEEFGPVNIICIDEVHRVPEDGDGQYRTFLDAAKKLNPDVKLIGLTATPYRTSSGMICGPGKLFSRSCYEIGVRELIVKGFLSPLKSKSTTEQVDLSKVHIRAGEFKQDELQAAMMDDQDLVVRACLEIAQRTEARKSVLVFCSGVEHAKQVAQFLRDIEGEETVRTVFSETPSDERAATIKEFRGGSLKYLVNVDVLTTGFDAPNVSAVAVLRPTMSAGLWYQMCGRGFRIAQGKENCLILDYGQNLIRHGPVDRMVIEAKGKAAPADPWKECPACLEVVARGCEVCPDCGTKFEKQEREPRGIGHEGSASDREALSGPETIAEIDYQRHEKMKDGRPSVSLRVNYYCGLMHTPADFVCLEHKGFARTKAEAWWRGRSGEPIPKTVDEALRTIHEKGIREPKQIVFKSEGIYLRAEKYIDLNFNPKPHVLGDAESVPF